MPTRMHLAFLAAALIVFGLLVEGWARAIPIALGVLSAWTAAADGSRPLAVRLTNWRMLAFILFIVLVTQAAIFTVSLWLM